MNEPGSSRGTIQAEGKLSCPYCRGEAFHLLFATDRNRRTTRRKFEYQKCAQCGLIFMDSPPSDMAPFYEGGYDPIPSTASELRSIATGEKYRTEPVLKYKSRGRCLEIGPWRGVICSNMKDAGFEVTAIEMDAKCLAFLRDQLGIQAIQSCDPAETMKTLEPGFDLIIAWHSLEHLPNAWSVIERAAQLLNPGGILLLAMPNPDSYEFSVLKGAWMHLDAPRHLYLFPIKTLIQICENNGLKLLELTTADTFSNIQSRHAWQHLLRSSVPIPKVRQLLAITVGNLLYWLGHRQQMSEGRGSAYTAIFVRR